MLSPQALRARIEHYYAAVPRLFSEVEDFGPLELFVRKEPGAPFYGGPDHARPVGTGPLTLADLERVRARQRERGVPEAFEWVQEVRPELRGLFESEGRAVAERPLMVLDQDVELSPQPLPGGVTLRALDADDPALPAALALPLLAFDEPGTAVGLAGPAELAAAARKLTDDGTVGTLLPSIRAGHKVVVAALDSDGTPLAAGQYHPAVGAAELGGVGTLPTARRQGLAAALTVALAEHAREHGVQTVFLAYALETVARLYARLGFRLAGTTLLVHGQPARGA